MEKTQEHKGEIIVYQPNETISLEVHLEQETVWLSVSQMSLLFDREDSNIRKHIINVFAEGELEKNINVHFLHVNGIKKPVPYYSLDVIISVGYRVKSLRGTLFRQWANKILKEYLMNGIVVNQRISDLENRIDKRFQCQENILARHSEQIDFFIQHSLPPIQGIFYNGQIFDAYTFANDLIRSANSRIILIDNYVDDTVLKMLDKRKKNVIARIYTKTITEKLQLDLQKHIAQYASIEILKFANSHDRFLILDNVVYLVGASLKDLGKKMFAFSKMETSADDFLKRMQFHV